MKKIMHIAALALIVTIMANCTNTAVVTYPEDIKGYWEAASNEQDKWYGLDITDATTALLITYYTEDDPVEQVMSVTYDAETGKGKLSGEGKLFNLKATSDTTLTLTMVEGTVVFYRGVRTKPAINLVGLWKSNRIDDYGVDLLVYPKDSTGINHITLINVDEFFGEKIPTMGSLTNFDSENGNCLITTEFVESRCQIVTSTTPMTMTLEELNDFYLTKEPKANNMPKSLQGVWKWSALVASITITVSEDNKADIYYQTVDDKGKNQSGTVKGDVYYCPAAGMGAVVPHNLKEHPELTEYIGHPNCGIFQMTSATQVDVSFNGISFTFTKK